MDRRMTYEERRAAYFRKREREVRRNRIIAAVILLVILILVGKGIRSLMSGGNVASSNTEVQQTTGAVETTTEPTKLSKILAHKKKYPKALRILAKRNSETIDFVYDYPKMKDEEPADTIGAVTKGEIPSLLQWDERWGYTTYVDTFLAVNGCGPTALSMVAAGLTGDDTITPYEVAEFAAENGYYVEGTGTEWRLMSEGCAEFGLKSTELSLDETVITRELTDGHPIICSMGAGDFTSEGHFIVLVSAVDGQIQVYDPNSRVRSRLWSYEDLAGQINNLWSFTLEDNL